MPEHVKRVNVCSYSTSSRFILPYLFLGNKKNFGIITEWIFNWFFVVQLNRLSGRKKMIYCCRSNRAVRFLYSRKKERKKQTNKQTNKQTKKKTERNKETRKKTTLFSNCFLLNKILALTNEPTKIFIRILNSS